MNISPFKNRGFVLLYALLVASVVLVIGLTLSNIIVKQLIISSISREMNNAYYAANTGRECASVVRRVYDAAEQNNELRPGLDTGMTVDCAGDGTAAVTLVGDDMFFTNPPAITITYQPEVSVNRVACAEVDIQSIKNYIDPNNNYDYETMHVVQSRGYNTACDDVVNNRKVERVLCSDFDPNDSLDPDPVTSANEAVCSAER